MRRGRDLILASLPYAKENKAKSWYYTLSTMILLLMAFAATLILTYWPLQLLSGVIFGLMMVRFFILYHDYNHRAILKNSRLAKVIMTSFGLFILAPITIWKRTHDHHHCNNSKLSNSGIGSYPLLSRNCFLQLSKKQQNLYLISRHPLTIFMGYLSLFICGFGIKTFMQSPKKHWDSILAVIIHITIAVLLFNHGGVKALLFSWIGPFIVSNGLGAYLFYAQHNFPGAKFVENQDWDYTQAAMMSTSFLKMGPIMRWFTGNIGYHHVHHLNHHIPFYRLREAMAGIPEMQNPIVTTFYPKDVMACLKLKVWDPTRGKLIGLKEISSP